MKKAIFLGVAVATAAISLAVGVSSGLNVGDMTSAFDPKHIAGPDKGTNTCPVCKYGMRPAVQVWVSPGEKPEVTEALAKTLSASVDAHKSADLKGFVVMMTACPDCEAAAEKFATGLKFNNVGITTLPTTDGAVKAYKVSLDEQVRNTVIVYRNRRVTAKFVNLTDSKADLAKLNAAIGEVTK